MKKLLVIGYVWPEPNSSAAGSRMLQILDIFQQQDYHITYASPACESEHRFNLTSIGIEEVSIELNSSSFDEYVKALQPDVVIFDRFMMEEQFSWRVDKSCPGAFKLLETVDLHCLREARQTAVKSNQNVLDINQLELHTDTAIREVASILRCDLSLIISEVEIGVLTNTFNVPEYLLLYLPFMYEPLNIKAMLDANSKSKWPGYNERENFITIGNFRHAPNWDSVLYLKNIIWPLIRKELKTAELHIYGSYPPKKAQQLHNPKQGFYIKGWADDALETLSQYRVCLSPLRFGAGMKGKLADAMLTGTPSVTTSIGAESMYTDIEHTGYSAEDWPGVIEDNNEKLADSAIRLYNDENQWQEKQNNIFAVVNTVFNKEKNEKYFVDKFNTIANNLEEHRNNNFTGKMLRHHTMKSAMYMSQWIEAKNKLGSQK